MKKILSFVFIAVLAFASCSAFVGCTKREELLKIYVPGEYIDEDLFEEFEERYEEETGKRIRVQMSLFNNVEEMLTRMDLEKPDFDLICPSDYAIERMIENGWVQKIDKTRVDVEEIMCEEYVELSREFDPTLEYSVPYMYGTYGIMYNYEKTGKHLTSWSSIFTDEFSKDIYQKKSVREFYVSACIYAKRDELRSASNGFTDYGDEYRKLLNEIYSDTSDDMIEAARKVLRVQKDNLRKYDDEDAKFLMAQDEGTAGLLWSCDAGYVMGEYEDDEGEVKEGNPNLWYVIPEEGGNVYIDSYVVSAYAKNAEAANAFLEFLCEKDAAIANSYYAGAISPVKEAYDELMEIYTEEAEAGEGVFEDKSEDWIAMYMDMMFPSAETLKRCALNRDYKNAVEERTLTLMFASLTN